MSHRHRWALFEMRFDWLAMRPQGRLLSTHKTYAAAKRRHDETEERGRRIGILRSRDASMITNMRRWWPA